MIVAGSANPLLMGVSTGYNLTRSLRFRSSASAYLSRTLTASGSSQKFTWSGWVKRGAIPSSSDGWLFCSSNFNTSSNVLNFGIILKLGGGSETDTLVVGLENTVSGTNGIRRTTQVFRDPAAWYHIVAAVDTTQATASNRIKVYVNGSEVTSFAVNTDVSQNANVAINQSGDSPRIGAFLLNNSPQRYFDGYMTEVNFIDGQALTPSSFGQTSSTTGVWQPKKYTGTYGTNGFYLPFTDNSALTSGSNAGLGKDFSGNGNYWNTNNISITSGSTYDSMVDVPTQPTSSSETYPPCNYAVFSPIAPASQTNSEANLKVSTASVNATPATIFPSSGKWYAEIALVSGTYHRVGICNTAGIAQDLGGSANGWCYLSDGRVYNNGSTSSYGVTSTNGDIINIALDLDAGKIWYGKNGTWMASGSPSTGANPSQTFTANQSMSFAVGSGSGTIVYTGNFGQRPFTYTPPTGYVALNTYNLPTPTIGATASSQANKYMDVLLYTGDSTSNRALTGLNFQPDFMWSKSRSNAYGNKLYDAVRGVSAQLVSNSTDAESTTGTASLVSFNSNGVTIGNDTGINGSGATFVDWFWKANGSGSSNTAGSITSTVSANTTSGFSVVTYTETSGSYTVGHGLGVTPAMIILKERNIAGNNWVVWQKYWTPPTKNGLYLNGTSAQFTTGANWFNSASSTTFGITAGQVTSGTANMVAYCFAEVAGFSKFGSYTGNGSSDGAFVYTGFRPKYVMLRSTSNLREWFIIDTARNPYNVADLYLRANTSAAEGTATMNDMVSNGFKLRSSDTAFNGSGETYIYMAFAENPFKYSLAR